jgi:hypothetical protein
VLGFRESGWMADFFSFLRCGPDHHTINLINSGKSKLHHTAFELVPYGSACDYLSLNGYKLIWGPGRHGIGHSFSPITAIRTGRSPNCLPNWTR